MKIGREQYDHLKQVALEGGALKAGRGTIWKVSGKCTAPVSISYAPTRSISEGVLDLICPCRRCDWCLKHRAWQWTVRGIREWAKSEKTWLCTFTYSPRVRGKFLEAISGLDDPVSRRRALVRAAGPDIQKYVRALRKSGARIRYLAVMEFHKDGLPHWHALVHGGKDLTWRSLDKPWGEGFTKFNLVKDVRGVRYVTKYLAKAAGVRVRASRRYGALPVTEGTTQAGAATPAATER